MSLYASYVQERTNDVVIEEEHAFATYRYLDGGTSIYLVDIFVDRDHRKSHIATDLADRVARMGRNHGCTEMIGTVSLDAKNATTSLKVLLAYGMELKSAGPGFIVLRKEL